jgi:ATP-dependent protease HslVU (ClpYQ) peptidase subunit
MTTIVGVQGDGFAVICVDSRISAMDITGFATQIGTLREGSSKVATNGKYLLGAAGDVRAINILHHVFQPPTPPPNLKGKKLDQFFTAKFIPALRECFDTQGYSIPDRDDKDHIAEHGSTILVVVNGVIFIVDGDYSWASEANSVYAIGSGSSYALGAMQVLTHNKKQTIQQAKTHAIKALTVSARFDPYTGPPYHSYVQEYEVTNKTRKPV